MRPGLVIEPQIPRARGHLEVIGFNLATLKARKQTVKYVNHQHHYILEENLRTLWPCPSSPCDLRRGVLAHPHRLNDNEAEAVAQPLSTVFSFIPHITSCLSLGILSFFPTGDSSLCCRMDRGWTRHLHCKPSLGKMYNPTMAASRVLQA